MDRPRADIKIIFAEALKLQTLTERERYLDSACGDDLALREEVESLLAAHDEAVGFLDTTDLPTGELPGGISPVSDGPGSMVGRYKLLQVIGEGGFGIVYMAEQQEPIHRRVALKIIKLGMDTNQVIARFEAERQALALMDHPNIAQVLDAGATETGRPYFVMELVKGVSITEYCDTNSLDTRQRMELMRDVCSAVQHAHHKGIIHRDIKPSNVMVTLHDGRPVPKIIDFGIAKAIQQRLTEKTLFTEYCQFIGTPQYMSPEQAAISGMDVDARTDVYSLGVLLYELLTGTTPFDARQLRGAAFEEIRRIIRESEPPKPSTRLSTLGETLTQVAKQRHVQPGRLRKLVTGDLDWIAMKSLEKDRNRRYATPSELAQDIDRYLANERVLAGPPGAAYRVQKWVRRHRSLAATTAAMILLAITVGSILAVHRDRKLERLTAFAEDGLANARVALAGGDYGNAQRELTYVIAQIHDVASLARRYRSVADDLLGRAELQLRLQHYRTLVKSARYAAQPLMGLLPEYWSWTEEELDAHLKEARERCRTALAVFDVVDGPEWQIGLDTLELSDDEARFVRESVAEILFMLADAEYRIGQLSLACCGDLGTRRAIARLDQVEELKPDLRSLYVYRAMYWRQLGADRSARRDSVRAEQVQASTWLDHWLLAHQSWPDRDRTVGELERALELKADDYWTWYTWGLAYEWAEEQAEKRIHHAMSVCINLQPQEAAGWIGRGSLGRSPGPEGRDAAIGDLMKGLELSRDPGLRSIAHYHLGVLLSEAGDTEHALWNLTRAVETESNFPGGLVTRGELYLQLGDVERAHTDFRGVLHRFSDPRTPGDHIWRIRALWYLGDWEAVIEECRLQTTHPDNVFSNRTTLAYAHYRLGHHEKTLGILRNGITVEGWFIYAMASWKLGKEGEGREAYRRGVEEITPTAFSGRRRYRIGVYEEEAARLIGVSGSERPRLTDQNR